MNAFCIWVAYEPVILLLGCSAGVICIYDVFNFSVTQECLLQDPLLFINALFNAHPTHILRQPVFLRKHQKKLPGNGQRRPPGRPPIRPPPARPPARFSSKRINADSTRIQRGSTRIQRGFYQRGRRAGGGRAAGGGRRVYWVGAGGGV